MSGLLQWLQQQAQQPSNLQNPDQATLARIAQGGQMQTLADKIAQQQGGGDPGVMRQAVHNLWQRYGAMPNAQQPHPSYSAHFAGFRPMPNAGMPSGGMPPFSAPPPPGGGGQGNFNPSSIRVDFHPPPEPQ